MLMYNKSQIANIANEYGFQRDTFEKVLRLNTVLEYIQEDTCSTEDSGKQQIRRCTLLFYFYG